MTDAHRISDAQLANIMMDARPMYPKSWHPTETKRTLDFKKKAKHYSRTDRPVKYYFIDFEHSRRYKAEERPPMEFIVKGGDKSPPEQNIPGVDACDPFPTDVYVLGNVIRQFFIQVRPTDASLLYQ